MSTYTEDDVKALAAIIDDARTNGILHGNYTLARWILDRWPRMVPHRFVDELRSVRIRLGFGQREVAEAVGVGQATLCNWERHHGPPTAENLQAWASALGVVIPPGVKAKPGALAACGTRSGYHRHQGLGEPACRACRDANAAYRRQYKASGGTS